MRIHGPSPLYNYVELIFRYKRMFIVSIVLGTLITSLFVYTRAVSYEAFILVALTGDPESQKELNKDQVPINERDTPAGQKTGRLRIWIERQPEWLESVVVDSLLDKKYPGKTVESMARDIRKKLGEITVINGMYMEVRLNWPVADEAETILRKIYERFSRQTIIIENAVVINSRKVLEDLLKKADNEANLKSKKRVAYMADHYPSLPAMMQQEMSTYDQQKRALSDATLDLGEYQNRLETVNRQLLNTKQFVDRAVERTTITEDISLVAKQELDGMVKSLNDLRSAYSDLHPRVQEQLKKIADQEKRVKEMSSQPQRSKGSNEVTRTENNPLFEGLKTKKFDYEQNVHAGQQKVASLQTDVDRIATHIKGMPNGELAFGPIDRDSKDAEQIRSYMRKKLAAARFDEDRDKMTHALNVKLEVPPKAEKVDSGGKVLLLYVLGPFLGILIAFVFSLFAESMDHTLRTPVEVEKYLGKPVLAVIPKMQPARQSGRKRLAGSSRGNISS